MFALKNLGFDCRAEKNVEFSKVVTLEFIYKVLDSEALYNLRE